MYVLFFFSIKKKNKGQFSHTLLFILDFMFNLPYLNMCIGGLYRLCNIKKRNKILTDYCKKKKKKKQFNKMNKKIRRTLLRIIKWCYCFMC